MNDPGESVFDVLRDAPAVFIRGGNRGCRFATAGRGTVLAPRQNSCRDSSYEDVRRAGRRARGLPLSRAESGP